MAEARGRARAGPWVSKHHALATRAVSWASVVDGCGGTVVSFRFLPYVGMVTIVLNEYPKAKYVLVGIMALFVLTSKE